MRAVARLPQGLPPEFRKKVRARSVLGTCMYDVLIVKHLGLFAKSFGWGDAFETEPTAVTFYFRSLCHPTFHLFLSAGVLGTKQVWSGGVELLAAASSCEPLP